MLAGVSVYMLPVFVRFCCGLWYMRNGKELQKCTRLEREWGSANQCVRTDGFYII
jgi:hypothetical protein